MAIGTYSELKTEIEDHLDHDDVAAKADTFIDLAEARIAREIRVREMEERTSVNITDRFLDLPDRFEQMRTLRILSSETTGARIRSKPKQVTLDALEHYSLLDAGIPQLYAVHAQIEFERPPETTLPAELIYYAHMTPLSDAAPTHDLLTRAPDAYLYAALVAAEPWLVEDERITLWESLYVRARDGLNQAYTKSQYGTPVASRVSGSTP